MKKLLAGSFFLLLLVTGTVLSMNIFTVSGRAQEEHIMSEDFRNMSPIAMKNISITIAYDNNPYKEGLTTAWGFSCLIRGTEETILFDTGGNSPILLANLKRLGVDPKEIDIVALSHIHGDHVGGLEGILDNSMEVTIYLPDSFPKSFKGHLRSYGININEVQRSTKICESVYSTGELGIWMKEQSLILHTDKGLILITGCAHPGIVKIIKHTTALIEDNVLLVMGGFHLGGKNKAELEEIILKFKESGVTNVGPCHCSGALARQMFKKEYQNNYMDVGVGRLIKFESKKTVKND